MVNTVGKFNKQMNWRRKKLSLSDILKFRDFFCEGQQNKENMEKELIWKSTFSENQQQQKYWKKSFFDMIK